MEKQELYVAISDSGKARSGCQKTLGQPTLPPWQHCMYSVLRHIGRDGARCLFGRRKHVSRVPDSSGSWICQHSMSTKMSRWTRRSIVKWCFGESGVIWLAPLMVTPSPFPAWLVCTSPHLRFCGEWKGRGWSRLEKVGQSSVVYS